MDNLFKITKKNFENFLKKIKSKADLYAPVRTDALRFEKIDDIKKINLETLPDFPLKEFFFRSREKLFSFNGNEIAAEIKEEPKRVFFGVRRCDLNAVAHQDLVFMEKYHDPYYTAQRKNSVLIGYHCNEAPTKYCFCGSMDLKDYYDLMVWDKGSYYLIHAKTENGKLLMDSDFEKTSFTLNDDYRKIKFTDKLKNRNIEALYDNPAWKGGSDKCISCAACTTLCPTCYCHEIKDEVSLSDLKKGERLREWSSCQLVSFTKVAGGHVFRDSREERFKHRIYHQLQYFKERYNVEMCVGCGRCITHCPTEIDFISIINDMSKEKKEEKK